MRTGRELGNMFLQMIVCFSILTPVFWKATFLPGQHASTQGSLFPSQGRKAVKDVACV